MAQGLEVVILAVILGTLFAIVYSLRVLVLMERRVARIDTHIESLVMQVLEEEHKIEEEESKIEQMIKDIQAIKTMSMKPATTPKKTVKRPVKKTASKKVAKKATPKKVAKKVAKKATKKKR